MGLRALDCKRRPYGSPLAIFIIHEPRWAEAGIINEPGKESVPGFPQCGCSLEEKGIIENGAELGLRYEAQ